MPTSGNKPSIVFFGSGPVAAESLELLLDDFTIEAVMTKPRLAHHRGDTPVVDLCEGKNIPFHTPTNKQELSEFFADNPFTSKLGLVVDYGIIISKDVIDYFPLGIVNSHFSLLPEWRGADPISFAILSGQEKTGVSLMLINEKMDEGKILAVGVYDMPKAITTPELTKNLIHLSDALLKNILPPYISSEKHQPTDAKTTPKSQEEIAKSLGVSTKPTYSRKLTKEDGVIDWQKPAEQIEREIRAFIDWPKSRATLAGKDVVITKAKVSEQSGKPGETKIDGKKLIVFCGNGALEIEKLKPAGKQEMAAEAFLAGHKHLLQ